MRFTIEGDGGSEHERGVDQDVLGEQHAAQERQVAERAKVGCRHRRARRHAHVRLADERRQAAAEDGEGEAGDHLIEAQSDDQEREGETEQGAGDQRGGDAGPDRAEGLGRGKAVDRADQHGALEAEVEDARALRQKLALRREQHRRGGDQRGREQQFQAHARAPSVPTRRMR